MRNNKITNSIICSFNTTWLEQIVTFPLLNSGVLERLSESCTKTLLISHHSITDDNLKTHTGRLVHLLTHLLCFIFTARLYDAWLHFISSVHHIILDTVSMSIIILGMCFSLKLLSKVFSNNGNNFAIQFEYCGGRAANLWQN